MRIGAAVGAGETLLGLQRAVGRLQVDAHAAPAVVRHHGVEAAVLIEVGDLDGARVVEARERDRRRERAVGALVEDRERSWRRTAPGDGEVAPAVAVQVADRHAACGPAAVDAQRERRAVAAVGLLVQHGDGAGGFAVRVAHHDVGAAVAVEVTHVEVARGEDAAATGIDRVEGRQRDAATDLVPHGHLAGLRAHAHEVGEAVAVDVGGADAVRFAIGQPVAARERAVGALQEDLDTAAALGDGHVFAAVAIEVGDRQRAGLALAVAGVRITHRRGQRAVGLLQVDHELEVVGGVEREIGAHHHVVEAVAVHVADGHGFRGVLRLHERGVAEEAGVGAEGPGLAHQQRVAAQVGDRRVELHQVARGALQRGLRADGDRARVHERHGGRDLGAGGGVEEVHVAGHGARGQRFAELGAQHGVERHVARIAGRRQPHRGGGLGFDGEGPAARAQRVARQVDQARAQAHGVHAARPGLVGHEGEAAAVEREVAVDRAAVRIGDRHAGGHQRIGIERLAEVDVHDRAAAVEAARGRVEGGDGGRDRIAAPAAHAVGEQALAGVLHRLAVAEDAAAAHQTDARRVPVVDGGGDGGAGGGGRGHERLLDVGAQVRGAGEAAGLGLREQLEADHGHVGTHAEHVVAAVAVDVDAGVDRAVDLRETLARGEREAHHVERAERLQHRAGVGAGHLPQRAAVDREVDLLEGREARHVVADDAGVDLAHALAARHLELELPAVAGAVDPLVLLAEREVFAAAAEQAVEAQAFGVVDTGGGLVGATGCGRAVVTAAAAAGQKAGDHQGTHQKTPYTPCASQA